MKSIVLSDFAVRLFHARTLILYRATCFQGLDTLSIEALFEQMEDDFTLAVASLTSFAQHPEFVTAEIAKASSEIMKILLATEAILSDHRKDKLARVGL